MLNFEDPTLPEINAGTYKMQMIEIDEFSTIYRLC